MELATIIALVLFLTSEAMPYLPIKGNGVVSAILNALMKAFPLPEADKK